MYISLVNLACTISRYFLLTETERKAKETILMIIPEPTFSCLLSVSVMSSLKTMVANVATKRQFKLLYSFLLESSCLGTQTKETRVYFVSSAPSNEHQSIIFPIGYYQAANEWNYRQPICWPRSTSLLNKTRQQ
jgi:hypothetical protein